MSEKRPRDLRQPTPDEALILLRDRLSPAAQEREHEQRALVNLPHVTVIDLLNAIEFAREEGFAGGPFFGRRTR